MYLILIGAPGSGKGTQAKRLVEYFDIDHISTGDMLRSTAAEDSPVGRMVKQTLDEGNLVSDELVAQLVDQRLDQLAGGNGFVMDGYPRTAPQANTFDQSLARHGLDLSATLLIEVDDDTVVARISGRRIDPQTGQIYNLDDNGDIPAEIRARLQQREDDTEEVMRARLRVYHGQIAPVSAHYQNKNLLLRLDGATPPEEVFAEILRQLEAITRPG